MNHTATYSPEDNKLRIYPACRLDADTYARVKAAGFAWAPKQEIFVAPMWTPARAALAAELCPGGIGDEDTSLAERAEDRAERFAEYREHRAEDATRARDAVAALADGIPLGQPILVGHHSERHARKDAERIDNGMRRAVKMWETSEYWRVRAAGAIRHARYKERADVRARRIKGLEADQRKHQRTAEDAARTLKLWETLHVDDVRRVAGNTRTAPIEVYLDLSADPPRCTPEEAQARTLAIARAQITYAERWLQHIAGRLEYERAMLADGGGLPADRWDLQPGGVVHWRGQRAIVLRVNRKDGRAVSVSVVGQGWTVGIEEITDYTPPTPEAAAAVKKPPLCNYPGEGFVHITQAQWDACSSDYKSTKREPIKEGPQRHRVRVMLGVYAGARGPDANQTHAYPFVYITDAKRVDPPPLDGPPPKGRRPARSETAASAAPARSETAASAAPTRPEPPHVPVHDRPCAAEGLTSYRARGRYGWIMIGAADDADAWREALRSTDTPTDLQRWDGTEYRIVGAPYPPAPSECERLERRAAIRAGTASADAEFAAMREALRAGTAVQVVTAPQLFPTPADVAARMVDLADVQPGETVLEPSVGTGALVRAVRDRVDTEILGYEIDPRLCDGLRQTWPGYVLQVRCRDFLTVEPEPGYPVVLMNPPFANAADITHILHARRFLAPGGRLVAICAAGPRQHEALQPLVDSWEYLPPGTFAGTDVRAVLLTMRAAA